MNIICGKCASWNRTGTKTGLCICPENHKTTTRVKGRDSKSVGILASRKEVNGVIFDE